MRDSLAEWSDSNDDIRAGITRLVSTPSSRRAFLLGGGAVLGGVALVGSGLRQWPRSRRDPDRARRCRVPRASANGQKLTGDLAVVALAASLENLAVGTYQAAIDAATQGKLTGVPARGRHVRDDRAEPAQGPRRGVERRCSPARARRR